ncbi:putative ATPase [Flavobacterium endophyticum]|uniref:Putative ATPase n=1 Tax=Flavobacterium endophyticum TaxID=1540163 RepID=A0A495MKC1_9FLAO|nr:AAA family ATPase [Flavobacterium endophyticum]RKS25313.1 putative ATPase [Flavobacterium endophyticum]
MKFQNEYFYILTGGPGVGKTAVLDELQKSGYSTVPETARAIIKEQIATAGEALPWKNKERYMELMLLASVESYKDAAAAASLSPLFFDRGILDAFCYAAIIGKDPTSEMQEIATTYRYSSTVFIFPPWKAIYETDSERKQDWNEAEATFEQMKKTYEAYGYKVIEVPKGTVAERKDFILHQIHKQEQK